ncbi:unnamed protein product [Rotaria sordida]|uniref:Uncharacterized protein n=1 Tax=Rotaria sordida TaxID=392033 RepID=A0A820AM81_9BILA|nr:unnamed protein product [Rotaria sordida]CAF4191562.1 unnamed protein product [Rotaria sordida]
MRLDNIKSIFLLISVTIVIVNGTFIVHDFNGNVLNSIEPELLKRIHQDLIKRDRHQNATDLLSTYNMTSGNLFSNLSTSLISHQLQKRSTYTITIDAHIENIGWSNNYQLGQVVGTEGRSLRLEAYRINSNPYTSAISYRSHVEDVGWLNYVNTNEISGTTGQSRRLEALQINIQPSIAQNVYYRCHLQNIGWTGWVGNNEVCGTTGQHRRLEAFVLNMLVF